MIYELTAGTKKPIKLRDLRSIARVFATSLIVVCLALPTYADSVDDAIEAIEDSNYDLALELLSEPLERDDPRAQYYFGRMHIGGNNVPKDINEAFNWILRAANSGLADAQHDAGAMYFNGEGTEANHEKAVIMFTLAAEQGNEISQFNLGLIYAGGFDIPPDPELSIKWYTLSADQGYASSQYNLGFVYFQGVGTEQNFEHTFELFTMAAENGLVEAQHNLGALFAHRPAGNFDLQMAYMWTYVAALNGYDDPANLNEHIRQSLSPKELQNASVLTNRCIAQNLQRCGH